MQRMPGSHGGQCLPPAWHARQYKVSPVLQWRSLHEHGSVLDSCRVQLSAGSCYCNNGPTPGQTRQQRQPTSPCLGTCGCRCPSLVVAPLVTSGLARHLGHMLHGLASVQARQLAGTGANRHAASSQAKGGRVCSMQAAAMCRVGCEALCRVHAAHKVVYAGCS